MNLVYVLLLLAWSASSVSTASAQPWTYNFGTAAGGFTTANTTAAYPPNTLLPAPPSGVANLRKGNDGGGWGVFNDNAFGIGTASNLVGQASTGASSNKFWIEGYAPGRLFRTKFDINFANTTATYEFFQGKGSGMGPIGNVQPTDVFAGLRFTTNGSTGVSCEYLNGNAFAPLSLPPPGTTGTHTFEIFGNNRLQPVKFTGPDAITRILAAGQWALYEDGVFVDVLSKGNLPPGTDVTGFGFTTSNSPGAGSIKLDNITYSNTFPLLPYVAATPLALTDFGNSVVGFATNAQPFTVMGSGLTNDIIVTPPPGFEISLNPTNSFGTTPIILAKDGSGVVAFTNVYVRFKPGVTGPTGPQNVQCSAPPELVSVSVQGTGVLPTYTINPSAPQTFPGTNVGASSATIAFTVGGSNLVNPLGLSLTGPNPGDFEISYTNTPNFTHEPSGLMFSANNGVLVATTFYVRFKPSVAGSRAAQLSVSSLPGVSTTVSLSGTGNAAPTIGLSPSGNMAFNGIPIGGSPSMDRQINIDAFNLGAGITATLGGANASQFEISTTGGGGFTAAGVSIPYNQSAGQVHAPIFVRFKPTAGPAGLKSATLSFSGGGAPVQTVNLSGTALLTPNVSLAHVNQDWANQTDVNNYFIANSLGAPPTFGVGAFNTIQGAIDVTLPAGTVKVYAASGAYNESLNIYRSVHLTGVLPPNPLTTAGPDANAPVLDGMGFSTEPGIRIIEGASNVTIEGFYIQNYPGSGIVNESASPINNVQINNNSLYGIGSAPGSAPIYHTGGGAFVSNGWHISQNVLDNFIVNGIVLENVVNSDIRGNHILNVTDPSGAAIVLSAVGTTSGSMPVASDNVIANNMVDDFGDGAGIILQSKASASAVATLLQTEVRNNNLSGAGVAVAVFPTGGTNSVINDVFIHDNTLNIVSPISTGTYGDKSLKIANVQGPVKIIANAITLSGASQAGNFKGISIDSDRQIMGEIRGNTIDGGNLPGNTGPGLFFANLTGASNFQISGNFFMGFDAAIGNIATAPAVIDIYNNSILFGISAGIYNIGTTIKANCNWWGNPGGPTAVPNSIAGTGMTVAMTYMQSGVDGSTAVGFQGDNVCIAPPGAILQDLVNATPGAGMLQLQAGDYFSDNTAITGKITIDGMGSGTVIKPSDGALINTYDPTNPAMAFGNNYKHAFIIQSDSVIIKNVTIDGDATLPCDQRFGAGIISDHTLPNSDYQGVVIENVSITNVYSAGIQLFNVGEGDTVMNATISNVCLKDDTGTMYPYANGIYVNSPAVIQQNTISDAGTGIRAEGPIGLGTNPMNISNNTITTMDYAGIVADLGTYNPNAVVNITNNVIDGVGSYGIEAHGLTPNSVIGGPSGRNEIDVNSTAIGRGPGAGILLTASRGTLIDNNLITCSASAESGIMLIKNDALTATDTISVNNNNISNSGSVTGLVFSPNVPFVVGQGVGIFLSEDGAFVGGQPNGDSYAIMMDDTVSGFQTGIYTNGVAATPNKVQARIGSNVSMADVSVTVHDCKTGLLINGKSSATGTNNARSFYNNEIGIRIWGGKAYLESNSIYNNGVGIVVDDKGGVLSDVDIFDNKIQGNGLNLDANSTANVDASRNWWGTSSNCNATMDGTATIDFTPWFESGVDEDAADGFDGDKLLLHVAVQGAQDGGSGTEITEGLGLVDPNGTIFLHSPNFNENVVVTKNVTFDAQFEPSGVVRLDGLHMNLAGGVLKLMNGDFEIEGNLNLENGKIELVGGANLIVLPGATVTKLNDLSNSSYVVAENTGDLIRQVPGANQDVWFHIGTSTSYLPAKMNNNGGGNGDYGMRIMPQILNAGTAGAPLTTHVVGENWFIDQQPMAGLASMDLTVYWNASDELASFNRAQSVIRKWDGVSWTSVPTPFLARGTAGGMFFTSAQNITSFSPFGVFDAPSLLTCPDVPTPSPIAQTSCTPGTFNFDVTMGAIAGDHVRLYPAGYQGFNYDFGNPVCALPPCISNFTTGASTSFLPAPAAGGGTARVRIGGGNIFRLITGGGFDGVTGFPKLGAGGSQIELQASNNTTANKFSINGYNGGKSFYTKFNVVFAGGNNGQFFFVQGAGNSYAGNGAFVDTETFTGLRFTYGAFSAITTSYRNGSTWTPLTNPAPLPLQQTNLANVNNPANTPVYTIEVYGNNETTPVYYDRSGTVYTVGVNKWDLWINGMQVGDELSKALIGANTNVDSWMFYGISSTSGPARLYLDDIAYSNGNALAIDATAPFQLTTPTVSTTTNFLITANNGTTGCESGTTPVSVTITPGVGTPTVSNANQSLCTAGNVTFTAQMGAPAGTEMRLYTVATGGTAIATSLSGPNFNLASPTVAVTTTFYVASYSSALMCESTRVPVTLTIGGTIGTPHVSNPTVSLCTTGTASFLSTMGTPAGTTMRLYDAAVGGTLLASTTSGPVFILTTPSVSTTTTFFIAAATGACESTRVPVTVSFNNSIAPPSVTNPVVSVCGSGGATFVAQMGTPSGTEIRLYTVQTGGTPFATSNVGPNFSVNSPIVSTTTTFWLAAATGACESVRVGVTVDVAQLPQVASIPVTAISQCGSGTFTFNAQMQTPAGTEMRLYDAFSGGNLVTSSTVSPNFPLTTPNLTTSQNFWICAANSCGESGRIMVSAIITPSPAAPIVANPTQSICSTGTATFIATNGAPAGTEMRLYNAATGGILLGSTTSGPSFSVTTPSVSVTTDFWIAAASGACEGPRTKVTVTVGVAPGVPSVSNPMTSVCGNGAANFIATMNAPAGTEMRLYDAATGGSLLATTTSGPNFSLITPNVSSTTNFFVAAANSCGESARVQVTVSVTGAPSIPVVNAPNASRCGTGTVMFMAQMGGVAGTEMRLYSAVTGGTLLASSTSGPNFMLTSPTVTSTTNFFIAAATGSCESARTQVTAVVTAALGSPTIAQSNILYCGNGPVTFQAFMGTPAGIDMRLYDVATGGTPLAISAGPNFTLTTPALSGATTNFWIAAGSGPLCESVRVMVTATPASGAPATPTVSVTSQNICGNGTATFSATMNTPAGTEIRLYDAAVGGNVVSVANVGPNFNITTPSVSSTTTFWLAAHLGANCSSVRIPVTVNVSGGSSAPFVAQPNLSRCGTGTLTFTAQMGAQPGTEMRLFAAQTGGVALATSTSGPNFNLTTPVVSTTTAFWIASASGTCEGPRVQVIATIMPAPGTPTVSNTTASTCGSGNVTFTAQMGSPAGVQIRLFNASSGGSVIASSSVGPNFSLVSTPIFSTTNFWIAAVSVDGCESNRVQVTGMIANSPFVSANTTNATCSQGGVISAFGSGGAGFGYTYSIDGFTFTNTTGTFTGLNPGTYTVTVKDANGCTNATTATVNGLPSPTVQNATVNGTSVTVSWTAVSSAASYTVWYRIVGNSTWTMLNGITGTSTTLLGLVAGTNYEVQVRAVCANGTTGTFSPIGTFTTGSQSPVGNCATPINLGITVTTATTATATWIPNVSGAVCYIVSYGPITTNPAVWPQFLVPHPGSSLQLTGLLAGTTYGINIRTNCSLCSARSGTRTAASATLTFNTPMNRDSETARLASEEATRLSVYPNPNKGAFTLLLNGGKSGTAKVEVTDLTGRVVLRKDVTVSGETTECSFDLSGQAAGVYLLRFRQGDFSRQVKVVIQ